jgi:hypothetical protein
MPKLRPAKPKFTRSTPKPEPEPSRSAASALPADSVVLSREEWLAVEHLIDTHPDARTRP